MPAPALSVSLFWGIGFSFFSLYLYSPIFFVFCSSFFFKGYDSQKIPHKNPFLRRPRYPLFFPQHTPDVGALSPRCYQLGPFSSRYHLAVHGLFYCLAITQNHLHFLLSIISRDITSVNRLIYAMRPFSVICKRRGKTARPSSVISV